MGSDHRSLTCQRRRWAGAWLVAVCVVTSMVAAASEVAELRLDEAQVRGVVQRYVAAQLDPTGDHWRLGEIQINGNTTVPAGHLDLAVSHGTGVELVGPTVFHLRVSAADGSVRHLRVNATIDRETPVLVATRSLSRGEVLAEGDVAAVYRSLRSLPRDTVRRPDAAVGKRVVRPIPAGDLVRAALLAEVPVVSRGARVMLVAEQGGLRITTPGIAKEDGGAGEMVRVVNSTSGRVVNGRVVDAKTVEVTF